MSGESIDNFGLLVDGGKLFTEEELVQLSAALTAISQYARLQIVSDVARNWGITQSDLVNRHHLTQPSISRHIEILQRAGLLESSTNILDGRRQELAPNVIGVKKLMDTLARLFGVDYGDS